MTTPDVPLRMELTFELPGTAEQVWDAIATANGITAWFTRTELEEREGGAICFSMGEGSESRGTVTGWQPPGRFAFVEPDWAELVGHGDANVGPMVTEFLVEAQSGGTCVLRVVSSAFGTGADWEEEFFEEMEKAWPSFFENLRLYLTHFPGQRVTSLEVSADIPGDAAALWPAVYEAIGAPTLGDSIAVRDVSGVVERIGDAPMPHALLRLSDPVTGFLQLAAWDKGDGEAMVMVRGYLFSEDAPKYVEREASAWKAWLESAVVPTG